MTLTGLILAGGKSSRMGFDKVNLNFHGVRQIDWLHSILKKYCNPVFVSGSPKQIQGDFNFIEDHYETGGPINGILSAFLQFPTSSWLVVPVDMPNVDESVIQFMIDHRDITKTATCFRHSDKKLEPLPAIIENKAYPLLLNRFALKQTSLYFFLHETKAHQITPSNPKWLDNINEPSQLDSL